MAKYELKIGDVFGSWTIVGEAPDWVYPSSGQHVKRMRTRCACGVEADTTVYSLVYGRTKGCPRCSKIGKGPTTHGSSKDPMYPVWNGIRTRCLNPKCINWNRYGGRGIRMHEPWQHDFLAFRDWALANIGPREGREIDRIDNDGHYEPGNLRWATRKEQVRNSTHVRPITHPVTGETMLIEDWAKLRGFSPQCLMWRLDHGWPVGQALDTPSGGGKGPKRTHS